MKNLRNSCTGRWPVHLYGKTASVAAALALTAALPSSALAATPAASPAVTAAASSSATRQIPQTVEAFYTARNWAPLWLSNNSGDAAEQLITTLSNASVDGIDPDKFHVASLQSAMRAAWGGDKNAVKNADRQLSEAFVAYVDELRHDPGVGITYVDAALKPSPPTPLAILLDAASAKSLPDYVRTSAWANPIYGQLRQALLGHNYSSDHERQLLELNLQRARALPSGPGRYVLVNAAQQRLYMYDNRQPVDSMVVVVGKPKWQTPMLSAYIRFAMLNPYWYVPSDLAGEDVGQFVLKQGLGYLDKMGYEIVSDWTPNPTIIDPKTIDWQGVVDGKVDVMIRQKPGPNNFMGRIKFMFPNEFGVYLHDNPRRELFLKASRYFSGGCVRLEDAWRLSKWLFGRDLTWEGAGTEEPVPLQTPVPVYITYLTAMPLGGSIAYFDDAYGRDAAKLAQGDPNTTIAGR